MSKLTNHQRRQLRDGLLGPDHEAAYRENSHFNYAVNALIEMLPVWVDGLAEQAAQTRREAHQRIAEAEAAYFTLPPRGG